MVNINFLHVCTPSKSDQIRRREFFFEEKLYLVSTKSFLGNKNACYLTKVSFITEDNMLWHNYLYENILLTNKRDAALFGNGKAWVAGEGKESVGIN